MDRAGVAGCCGGPCTVYKLADPFAIGDLGGILDQGGSNGDIVDLFETARTLTFER